MSNLIKQDINFLEWNIWFQNREQKEGLEWTDRQEFIFKTPHLPPVKTDIIFLYYLLLMSQKENWAIQLNMSQYEILTSCNVGTDKWWYDRLHNSLDRWRYAGVEFQGTFYDGKKYLTLHFGIIDAWGIDHETKKLFVYLNPFWLLMIRRSNFFKYLDFDQIKALRSPLAIRLYELLIKTFQGRDVWEIDAVKLAEKIPMAEKYPAHIILKIKPAIRRINDHTSLKLKLTVRRPERGKAIFVFRKISQASQDAEYISDKISPVLEKDNPTIPAGDLLQRLLDIGITKSQANKIIKDVPANQIERNIQYADTHGGKAKNRVGYTIKAIREDYASSDSAENIYKKIAEDREREAEKIRLKTKERDRIRSEMIRKEEEFQRALDGMSATQKEALHRKAKDSLTGSAKKSALSIQFRMMEILKQRRGGISVP